MLPCPRCNQGASRGGGLGGGSGPQEVRSWQEEAALVLIFLVVLAVFAAGVWWAWRTVTQIAHKPTTPVTGTDHPVPPAEPRIPSDEQYKVIVNGAEAIGHGPSSWVSCDDAFYRAPRDATTVTVGYDNSFNPAPGVGGASALVTKTDPPEVANVDLHSYPNKHWLWNRGQQPGNAAVSRNGNTYRVTGSIAPAPGSGDGNPVPFEFEATCP